MQFILIVAASSVGEELFYRAAVQVCYWGWGGGCWGRGGGSIFNNDMRLGVFLVGLFHIYIWRIY